MCNCGNTGWNGHQIIVSTQSWLEKKFLPSLLSGFKLATFRSRVRRSNQQSIPVLRVLLEMSTTTMTTTMTMMVVVVVSKLMVGVIKMKVVMRTCWLKMTRKARHWRLLHSCRCLPFPPCSLSNLTSSDNPSCRRLAKLADDVVPGSSAQFQKMVDTETVEMDTRVAWKYACTRK